MIDPATGWFGIFDIPMFDLNAVMAGNDEYIDKLSARFRHKFNNTRIYRYLRPRKVVFDNVNEFKQDFVTFLKEFDIKPVLMSVKNNQANTLI